MHKKPHLKPAAPRPFWLQVLIVLGITSLFVLVGAVLLGDLGHISNLYFWSSIILFIIAVIPIASEIGGSAKIAGRAVKEGENVGQQLKEKQALYQDRAKITYVFGLSGLITFLASFLTIGIG
jgi:hypothetical protein